MPPSREACQLYLAGVAVKADLQDQVKAAREKLSAARKALADIKKGLVPKKGALIAIKDLAEAAAEAGLKAAVKAVGEAYKSSLNLLTLIFIQLYKIVLASPDSLFSLICVPKKSALNFNETEEDTLRAAMNNIENIVNITTRFKDKPIPSDRCYDAIRNALPYIKKAYNLITQVEVDLKTSSDNTFEDALAFDESKYNELREDISMAIEALNLPAGADGELDAVTALAKDVDSIYTEKSDAINKEHKLKKANITQNYLMASSPAGGAPKPNVDELTRKYNADIEKIDSERDRKLKAAKLSSATKALDNAGGNYRKLIVAQGQEFIYDAKRMAQNLAELSGNLVKAYSFYKMNQMYCFVIYNVDKKIKDLVREMLQMVLPSPPPTVSISQSQTYAGIAFEKAEEAINKYNKTDSKLSPIATCTARVAILSFLKLIDKSLDVTIEKGLKKLLDQKNVLKDNSGEFNGFISRIADIPDWDGKAGVWAVSQSMVASPYIAAIADAADVLVSLPMIFNSPNQARKADAINKIYKIRGLISSLLDHNAYVKEVLQSYTPVEVPELKKLMDALDKGGLLAQFAANLSLATIITQVQGGMSVNVFGTEMPNYTSCSIYKDLYDQDNLLDGAAMAVADTPDRGAGTEFMGQTESKAADNQILFAKISTFEADLSD